MKPHKHAEVIKAWADGATVEARYLESSYPDGRKWHVVDNPAFSEDWEYRVKPPKKWYMIAEFNGLPEAAFCDIHVKEWPKQTSFVRWVTGRIEYE